MSKLIDWISEIDFTGDLVPHELYKVVRDPKTGKLDALAVLIMSNIIYWYRGKPIYNEKGELIGYNKKFRNEQLQKSYKEYAEMYGVSKKTIKQKIELLMTLGLITREFKTIEVAGRKLNNVMFIEPNIEKLQEIFKKRNEDEVTYKQDKRVVTSKVIPLHTQKGGSIPTSNTPPTPSGREVSHPAGGDKYIDYNIDYNKEYNKDFYREEKKKCEISLTGNLRKSGDSSLKKEENVLKKDGNVLKKEENIEEKLEENSFKEKKRRFSAVSDYMKKSYLELYNKLCKTYKGIAFPEDKRSLNYIGRILKFLKANDVEDKKDFFDKVIKEWDRISANWFALKNLRRPSLEYISANISYILGEYMAIGNDDDLGMEVVYV